MEKAAVLEPEEVELATDLGLKQPIETLQH